MRDIKFRAWDEGNKIMHYDVEFIRSGVEGNDWIIFKSDKQKLEDKKVLDNPYFSQQIKLTQFTGLLDKNGKEICEGDIVQHLFYGEPFQVIWRKETASFIALYSGEVKDRLLSVDFEQYEIIGNIYENSDLLK